MTFYNFSLLKEEKMERRKDEWRSRGKEREDEGLREATEHLFSETT